jgi:hypothetical protein
VDDPISASRLGRSSPVSADGVFEVVGLDRERDHVLEPGRTLERHLDVERLRPLMGATPTRTG